MKYEIQLSFGQYSNILEVENVNHLALETDVYVMYNESNEIIFTSPKESVVYIKQI